MDISATNGAITTIFFYLKHYWDGGKAALRFGPDRIGLVSMGKILLALYGFETHLRDVFQVLSN